MLCAMGLNVVFYTQNPWEGSGASCVLRAIQTQEAFWSTPWSL